jgi:hypothetical protein
MFTDSTAFHDQVASAISNVTVLNIIETYNGIFHRRLFYNEDGGSRVLQNVGSYLPNCIK